jgi:hypothetical protein
MSSEIIQNVAYDNYDDFQHVNFLLAQNFISLFWELYNDETDLRVRYHITLCKATCNNTKKSCAGVFLRCTKLSFFPCHLCLWCIITLIPDGY